MVAFQKVESKKSYPPYQNKEDKKWENINFKKERGMTILNASNVAGSLLAAKITSGIFKPVSHDELMQEFTRLHSDIVSYLTMVQ